MLLEKNGRGSSGNKRTCHNNIRYFFTKDRIASDEVKLEYCPIKPCWLTHPLNDFKEVHSFSSGIASWMFLVTKILT